MSPRDCYTSSVSGWLPGSVTECGNFWAAPTTLVSGAVTVPRPKSAPRPRAQASESVSVGVISGVSSLVGVDVHAHTFQGCHESSTLTEDPRCDGRSDPGMGHSRVIPCVSAAEGFIGKDSSRVPCLVDFVYLPHGKLCLTY